MRVPWAKAGFTVIYSDRQRPTGYEYCLRRTFGGFSRAAGFALSLSEDLHHPLVMVIREGGEPARVLDLAAIRDLAAPDQAVPRALAHA
ncbi:hypothetical protein [Paracraurococcus ruber]|uniref:RES domain-containing protein n=1 Tax=Paracraurococcus ruber TaxID=77675 RepID=A0ABS1CQG3_9PROT|nr:hypothetical protein [Paracraurococcus ruber]MBK1656681.1 hypothetical protein [Paracraurococcus ruber]TDG33699.1 hypothetical protein E2C05_02440 [Paracraurococcus ruber]